ncbi:MAG TPA: cytochrome b [Steroidobacteraceae bacterium]|nr:cytochrome b [Steroidobacteraceae bacterium]
MPTDPLETLQPLSTAGRYGRGAMAFHWSMFILVVVVGILGLLHDDWPKRTQAFWINVHAMIGILLWLVLVARIGWRIRHVPPDLPSDIGALSRRLSSPVHRTLYFLLFITPLIGVVTFVYHGRVFDFGLFRIDPGVKSNRAIFHPTEDIHGYLAYAIFALAGLHALAALWHRFVLHDGVLARMWPSGSTKLSSTPQPPSRRGEL